MLLSIIAIMVYAISHNAAKEETVFKTETAMAALCNVWSSYIGMPTLCGRTYFFFERGRENSQYCV